MKRILFSFAFIILAFAACKKDKSGPQFGTVTDVEGNVYKTVKIGDQWWMAENLKTTKYNNGTPISNVLDALQWQTSSNGAYCNYANDPELAKVYGCLYNGYVVNTGNLAPQGWHVPTNEDWNKLINYLGGDAVAGTKLKESGETHWSVNNYGTNSSGFTALGAGLRTSDGQFFLLNSVASFWSSAKADPDSDYYYVLAENQESINNGSKSQPVSTYYGFSVRCVKD